MPIFLSIDPGIYKCGLILANIKTRRVLSANIIKASNLYDLVSIWNEQFHIETILIGNGTSSNYCINSLKNIAPIKVVDESGTTLKSRYRYWELSPPPRWINWFPKGLILPPDNLDAVAALVILEKYLGKKLEWLGPYIFKI